MILNNCNHYSRVISTQVSELFRNPTKTLLNSSKVFAVDFECQTVEIYLKTRYFFLKLNLTQKSHHRLISINIGRMATVLSRMEFIAYVKAIL